MYYFSLITFLKVINFVLTTIFMSGFISIKNGELVECVFIFNVKVCINMIL